MELHDDDDDDINYGEKQKLNTTQTKRIFFLFFKNITWELELTCLKFSA